MINKKIKRSKKAGLSPGSLIYLGETHPGQPRITFVRYDENSLAEGEIKSAGDLQKEKDKPGIIWVNIDGLGNVKLLEDIGNVFSLHPLALEDILNTDQRPKMEDYGDYLYIVLKNFSRRDDDVDSEQISLILGNKFVISFREKEGELFAGLKERLSNDKGRIRKAGADYLAHAIIDNVVDNYFIVMENMGDRIEHLENELVRQTKPATLHAIHKLKNELLILRKSLWPLRDAITTLQRTDSSLIQSSTLLYFKDIFDHVIAVIDSLETYREMASGMLDIYLSSVNKNLNEIMKVLAIIATIFMPLTFLAGVYGMNFQYMPELEWRWGYFIILGLMLAVALLMVCYFRKKKWF